MDAEKVDLTIIGAGWSGLAALKIYHEVHPTASILLLDAASSIGGVWAKHRLYPGLKSNNMRGTYEFSDFPMDDSFGVKAGEHIPGHVVHEYMCAFVKEFKLNRYIRLDTAVKVVEQVDEGWIVSTTTTDSPAPKTQQIHTSKLIICTGTASTPFLPALPNAPAFSAPLFHMSDLPKHTHVLHPTAKITVYGGTKSAWDAVYAAATAGAQVDWIIRETGHGPTWMAPAYVTPIRRWLEKLVTTRALTWFSPCIWETADGYGFIRRLLHGTWLGRKIVDIFWAILVNDVCTLNAYASHPETAKLRPWSSLFWTATSLSILNYPTDFFDLIRGENPRVKIHIDTIASLSENTVHLTNSGPIPSTALIACTGWSATPSITFLPSTLNSTLGLPNTTDPIPEPLVKAANSEILSRFPRLASQPSMPNYIPIAPNAPAESPHPYRLARFMVPPALAPNRNIAFLGLATTINTTMVAQAQALWTTAFFSDKLSLNPEPCPSTVRQDLIKHTKGTENIDEDIDVDLLWETALHTQFGVWRYPGGFGKRNADFVFDAVPYVDLLLGDLGVKGRGRRGWFGAVGVEDYRGVVGEWVDLRG